MAASTGTFAVKAGMAQMLKGGVIMDVVNVEQARIAEEAGACAVMALERVPADIRKDGGPLPTLLPAPAPAPNLLSYTCSSLLAPDASTRSLLYDIASCRAVQAVSRACRTPR